MSITEEHRRNIFNGLEEVIGTEQANHLMELLPTSPAAELVTRTDMHSFGSALRAELRGEMAELRGEMAELRGEMRTDMAALRDEMVDLKGSLNRLVIAGMAGNAIAVVTALAL